ncbi:ABC transporter permease [Halorubrum sp. Ib24]|uniref:ABC transporter permease n=1 Tax=Halorubrum sp. Ib24 TaxID=1383850 RepID=UPI0018E96C0B|nr:ABC transporter permease [Halorubrum sp. Ib24]
MNTEELDVDETVLTLLDNMIWPLLVVLSLAVAVLVPRTFRNLRSIEFILHGAVGLGFVTLAAGICLIAGYFDLSVGAISGFAAMLTGLVVGGGGWNLINNAAVGFALISLVGIAVGVFNGYLIGKVGINPFLQTLAMLIILDGATVTLSTVTVTGLPAAYVYPGKQAWSAITLLLIAFAITGTVLRYTSFGQAIYALGSDESSARAVGISTTRLTVIVYGISGFFSAIGGLMLTGFTGVVAPTLGDTLLFPAFAAAVIGGISLFGGRGSITGALGGVLLLGLIQSALNISGVQPEQIQLANGLVLFTAILLYNSRRELRQQVLSTNVSSEV